MRHRSSRSATALASSTVLQRESPEFPWVPIILAIVGGIAFLAILMYAIFTSLEPPPPQDTADDLADVAPETDADPKKLN